MKVTSGNANAEVTRHFTITENHPIVGMAYASTPKKVRIERGAITYRLVDGAWIVKDGYSTNLSGVVLKKDGSDSKLDHRRRAADTYRRDLRNADLAEKLTDDFQWLAPIINLLRPTGDVDMTVLDGVAVETLYRVICSGGCERYLTKEWITEPVTSHSDSAALFITPTSAYDEAVRRGWSRNPLLCPDCTKEADVNNKTAGLYVKLVNALNALEEAGEDLDNMYEDTLRGTSARVDKGHEGRWKIGEEERR